MVRVQRKSETFRRGIPNDHNTACKAVIRWYRPLLGTGAMSEENWPQYFSLEFMKQNKLTYPYHEYDVAFFEYIDDEKGKYAKLHTVVEVDGKRHDTKLV